MAFHAEPAGALAPPILNDPEATADLIDSTPVVADDVDDAIDEGRRHGEDTDLVAQAKEGFAGAYDELVRRHEARAYTLALRLCGDREAAKDITQDAFIQAWRSLDSFDQNARFGTWLHRIVVNTSYNASRSKRARPTQPLLEGTPWGLDPASPVRTEQVVQDREHEAALYRALATLPHHQRASLVLTGIMGRSYADAAEILDVSVGTVRGRVARARRTLTTTMKEWA